MIAWIKDILHLDEPLGKFVSSAILFLIGTVLATSFISFFLTWDIDQSFLLNRNAFEILFSDINTDDPAIAPDNAILDVQNTGGRLGALISKKFIHDWFGIASFAFVFICFWLILRIWNLLKNISLRRIVYITLSIALLMSLTFGFFCNDYWDGNIGGGIGYVISYQLLRNLLGPFITSLLIILIDIVYIFFTFKKILPFFISKFSSKKNVPDEATDENINETLEDENNLQEDVFVEPEQENITEENSATETLADKFENQETEEIISSETEQDIPEESQIIQEEESEVEDNSELEPQNEKEQQEETNIDESVEDEIENNENNETEDTEQSLKAIDGMDIINTNVGVENTDNIEMAIQEDYDPKKDLSRFNLPDISLLKIYDNDKSEVQIDHEEQLENKNLITSTLLSFGIDIEGISATIGPTITLYEIVPKAGTRISRIKSLENDIMMSLSALGIRIIAPIPGKGTVGIEVPNKKRQIVSMYSVINSKAFKESKYELPIALGKTITNDVYMFDLAKMPHLLVAGATGQGKSVGLNAIITSLLFKKHPSQLKFVLVDPKMVEFSMYAGLKYHYMAQYPSDDDIIITDCQKVKQTLNSLVQEMEDRYKLLMEAKCRNIIEYNQKFIKHQLNPLKGHKYLTYIVIIIDEFGDFIMQAGKEIETPIARIAQKARAVGMHLILATQRPSVNVITGIIKANIPGRIAFKTSSGIDSRTILDETGAEGLVGMGDLLASKGNATVERVQCAFVDTPEVEKIVEFIQEQQGYGEPMQLPEYQEPNQDTGGSSNNYDSNDKGGGVLDSLFEDAAKIVVMGNSGSTSLLQRKFSIGYNRAGRLMDQLNKYNIVGAFNGSKGRDILVDEMGLNAILNDLREKGILREP